MKIVTFTPFVLLFSFLLLLLCGDDPFNPLDTTDPRYEKITVDIVSDLSISDSNTIAINTEELPDLGISSNFLDRIDSIRIDYDISKITDSMVTLKKDDFSITSNNSLSWKIDRRYSVPGTYQVEIYLYTVNGDDIADTISIVVNGIKPTIFIQPDDTTVSETLIAGFTVAASGTSPIKYDWYFTHSTIEEAIRIALEDTTDGALNDDFVELSDSGYYFCIVRNEYGSDTSKFGLLTVTPQILDEDAPSISFVTDSSAGDESVDAVIALTLTAPTEKEVLARITYLASSSAVEESDFTILSSTVTIPPRSTSANLHIDVINDVEGEKLEIIALQISTARNAHISEQKTHLYKIIDDDLADSTWPEIFFEEGSGSGPEGENVLIRLGLDLKTTTWEWVAAVNCRVATASTASQDDYQFVDTLITFNINETSQRISLQTIKDKISENDETVTLTLSKPTKAILSSTKPTSYTYSIKDADVCYINFDAIEMTGFEEDTTNLIDSIKVTLSIPSVNDVAVRYAFDDELSTAVNQGTDYLLLGDGFVRFALETLLPVFRSP